VPVRELQSGDRLVDPKGSEVDVVSVAATGETATVYNFNVDELHSYHVEAGEMWVRVHNECTTRMRHYTSKSAADRIQNDGVLHASDQNKVFLTHAKGKPLSRVDAERTLGIKPGRGRSVLEMDVPNSRIMSQTNSRTGRLEHYVVGDLPLQGLTRVR
jgi:hypothetical protein